MDRRGTFAVALHWHQWAGNQSLKNSLEGPVVCRSFVLTLRRNLIMQFPNLVESDFDFHLKIIMVGDSGVGKSCLLKSFMGKEFTEGYVSTIGVDFEMKQTTIQGKKVNLQIWDTAGQERFRTITTSYYRSCDAILLVFDISDNSTFTNIEAWLEDVRSYARKDVNIMLIGQHDHKTLTLYYNNTQYQPTLSCTNTPPLCYTNPLMH
ncbi:hypothetical protein AAMO2058_000321200 [Amorphochlora amoebiformis]